MSSSGCRVWTSPTQSKTTASTTILHSRDLSNGFLIGEIVSRYEPGKIPMHAFQNSHNQTRRDGNWGQLSLFFKKHELRKVKIE